MWGFTTPQGIFIRLGVSFVFFGLLGCLSVEAIRYVDRQSQIKVREVKVEPPTPAPTAPPVEEPAPDLVGQIDKILDIGPAAPEAIQKLTGKPPVPPGFTGKGKAPLPKDIYVIVVGTIRNRGQVASIAEGFRITLMFADGRTVKADMLTPPIGAGFMLNVSPDPKSPKWYALKSEDYWPQRMDMNTIPANGISYGYVYGVLHGVSRDEFYKPGNTVELYFRDIRGKESTVSKLTLPVGPPPAPQ